MQLFYNPLLTEKHTSFLFDKEESKHIVKVLRKKEDDILFVTNGLGYLFKTQIILASDSKCSVSILSFEKKDEPKFKLHLAVAPTKMNERYEWFLEKVTEIGIQEITPIICENSERKVINVDRFKKIIETAMKQSLHCYLPKLNDPILFRDFLKQQFDGQKFIAHCEEDEKKSLKSALILNENVTILIGPEGDFSQKEILTALDYKFNPVHLGSTRLRTETAGVVACHSVVFTNQYL